MAMTWTPAAAASPMNLKDDQTKSRRQVEIYCQGLVDTGEAQWKVNEVGLTELHLNSGEAYLFDEQGLVRLK